MCCLLYLANGANAQSIGPSEINTMGKSTIINNITIEQSMGGVVAGNTFISSNLIVTPGTLQPKLVTPNAIKDPKKVAQMIAVFPNPTDQIIFIQGKFSKKQALHCTLSDALGRVVLQREFVLLQGNERQEINLTQIAMGQYNLDIQWTDSGEDFVHAFKIQKIK